MATVIEVKDLCKTYVVEKRQNNVLKNVNLKVEEGEMVAIMGPSASGKSTLLYSVSGMDVPTSGSVIFDGKDLTKISKNELSEVRLDDMGFVFQQMFMMKNLSILDNIFDYLVNIIEVLLPQIDLFTHSPNPLLRLIHDLLLLL